MSDPESPDVDGSRVVDGENTADRDGGDAARDDAIVEQISADAAFDLLGNETRLDVLRALFDADDELAFSALRDAVGIRDSGQFNYHLDKLLDVFVRKTDDGYVLTAEGRDVVGSILAGPYTKTIDADPVPVDATCSSCGGPLAGVFGEGAVRVTCRDCDRNVIRLAVPPGAFADYPREEWPVVAERWTRLEFEKMRRGFCRICSGPTRAELDTDPDQLEAHFAVGARYTCQRCGESLAANATASVVADPAVIAFHRERGVDVTETPVWDLGWAVRADATVVDEDPLRAEVPVECDGDRLILTLDENADVVEERIE